jgi:hypothetical protein
MASNKISHPKPVEEARSSAQCEHLFCQCEAVARLTAPHLKPRHFICEDHLREMLEWARPYRHIAGMVQIEPTEPYRNFVESWLLQSNKHQGK